MNLCSRSGPKVEGTWTASESDIANMEDRLQEIAVLRSKGWPKDLRITNPRAFFRQYIGIVVAGRRLIYVNAFAFLDSMSMWRERFVDICDGGTSVWGVLYDPDTKDFFDLSINGVA
jgi:hypothetical protein